MAGTLTVTTDTIGGAPGTLKFTRYTCAWVATAGGAVSGNAFAIVPGAIVSMRFTPGSGGDQPTNLYDVTIPETGGLADLSEGGGTDCVNTGDVLKKLNPPTWQDGSRTIDVVVANAGNAKKGTVTILVQTT